MVNLQEKAEQFDKLKELMSFNEAERLELASKLEHVVNGQALVEMREKATYQVDLYCLESRLETRHRRSDACCCAKRTLNR